MLVLTRKEGQEIHIGDHIIVKILGRKGEHIRIGVEAPEKYKILRDELIRKN